MVQGQESSTSDVVRALARSSLAGVLLMISLVRLRPLQKPGSLLRLHRDNQRFAATLKGNPDAASDLAERYLRRGLEEADWLAVRLGSGQVRAAVLCQRSPCQ